MYFICRFLPPNIYEENCYTDCSPRVIYVNDFWDMYTDRSYGFYVVDAENHELIRYSFNDYTGLDQYEKVREWYVNELYEDMVQEVIKLIQQNPDVQVIDLIEIEHKLLKSVYHPKWEEKGLVQD